MNNVLEIKELGLVELNQEEMTNIDGGLTAFDVIRWLFNNGQAEDAMWLASITPEDYVIC